MADEDVSHGRVQAYMLVASACLIAGLILQVAWQPAIEWRADVASALFTTGLIAVLWTTFAERWQARERDLSLSPLVTEVRQLRDQVCRVQDSVLVADPLLGVDEIRLGELDVKKFSQILRSTDSVDAVCLYDTRWRESWAEQTKTFLARPGCNFRLVLPDPMDAETVARLAERHCKDALSFKADIEALINFLSASDRNNAVEVRVIKSPGPSHTAYLFHAEAVGEAGVGVSRMYDHLMGDGGALPEVSFDLRGQLGAFHLASFEKVWRASQEYYPRRRMQATTVAVVGPGDADPTSEEYELALALGAELGSRGFDVVNGGLGGVMTAVSQGLKATPVARSRGILPSLDSKSGNPFLDEVTVTGKGQLRNADVVGAGHAVVAIGCNLGTWSEIALTAAMKKPLLTYEAWTARAPDGFVRLGDRLEDDADFRAAPDTASRAKVIADRLAAALERM